MKKVKRGFRNMFKKEDLTTIIYTGRGGGKTVLLTSLLLLSQDCYDCIFFFTSTFNSNKGFFDVIDFEKDIGFRVFDIEKYDLLKSITEVYNQIKKINDNRCKKEQKRFLCIFDDIFTTDNLTTLKKQKGNVILDIFNNGRHNSISIIILSQDLKYITKPMRKNTDIFITLNLTSFEEREEIINTLNYFDNKKVFNNIIYSLKDFEPLTLIRRNGHKYFGGSVILNFTKIINPKSKEYRTK